MKEHPDAIIVDVTSHATDALVCFSPFHHHGGIPVPFSPGWTATCVEAIWQGLKVLEHADIDTGLFRNDTMKDMKRTVRQFGKPLGHRKGVDDTELPGYIEARKLIYLPAYKWVLEYEAQANALPAIDFEGKVLGKLMNCVNHPRNFRLHLESLLRKGLLATDDYSLAVLGTNGNKKK